MFLYRIKEIQVSSVTSSLTWKQVDFANTLYSWEFGACGWSKRRFRTIRVKDISKLCDGGFR